ncbi:MAG: hypothetical protein MdMp024_0257 [Bacteroidales bacterium]|jgi:hypothetical protein
MKKLLFAPAAALAGAFLLLLCSGAQAQENADGGGSMSDLIYSPRYFGPSAFPMPKLRSGRAPERFEVEARWQYHYYVGDQTEDVYARALLPLVRGRAGLEVSWVIVEDYRLTPETKEERHAVASRSPHNYSGDVVVSAFYELFQSEKWMDGTISLNLKTASGGRLFDARFTDAATYWVDFTAGKDIVKSSDRNNYLRMQAITGFYCWMTNAVGHRQNDAVLFGGGVTGKYGGITLDSNLSGFRGYENNGDRPLVWRNNLRLEYKKNILSFRYDHGMQDCLYDTYSVAYIRCF